MSLDPTRINSEDLLIAVGPDGQPRLVQCDTSGYLIGNPSGVVNVNSGPAANADAITPSDSVDLTNSTRGIYVGVSGDITLDLVTTGTTIFFKAVPVGVLPVQAKRVRATNTTATNLVGMW